MRDRSFVPLLSVVWLVALVLSSLIAQQALPAALLTALGGMLLDVLAVAAMVALSGGIGAVIMPDLPRLSDLERQSLGILVGLGVISLVILVTGLLGWLPSRWLAWVFTFAAGALLRRPIWTWLHEMRGALCLPFSHRPGRFTRWLRTATLVMLALALISALAPPTKWDALTYHLAGPAYYLETGRITGFPENHFLGFPQFVEMLYLWLTLLARPQAAAAMHWVFGLVVVTLIIGLTRRLRRPEAGWLAAMILLSGLSVWGEFGWAYNDLAAMAAITAALSILLAWAEVGLSQPNRFLLWAGAFVGLAMSTKYTSAGAAVGIAVLAVWLSRRSGALTMLRHLAFLIVIAWLVFLPWLVKNTLVDGNPVSPFVWGTSSFDELDQWYYLRPGTGLDLGTLVVLPLQATVFGQEGHAPHSSAISPLLVGLLPLAAVGWRKRPPEERRVIVALGVFTIPVYLIWLSGAASSWFLVQMRLLFAIFPALALIGSLGIEGLDDTSSSTGLLRITRAGVAVVVAISVIRAAVEVAAAGSFRVALGEESEADYLSRSLGIYYVAMQEINQLPSDAHVLLLWEPRTLYCDRRCIPDSMIDQWWHDRQVFGDPARIAEDWREQGITHVLIHESGWRFLVEQEQYDPLTQADIESLDQLRRDDLIELWNGYGSYTLYALLNEEAP